MGDEVDPREVARTKRRDRDASAADRALMKPGMGKVFKQILDAQARAAEAIGSPRQRRRTRKTGNP